MKLQTKTIVQSILLAVGVIVLLSFISNQPTKVSFAQQANLAEAIKAVVRIRGCNVAGCNVGLGSGVIIHPSGVILTANHVTLTDPRNPLSPRLEDFVIEVTDNARQAPQARFRARLLAAKPEADLALLGIYWDEAANQPLDDLAAINLSALSIADVNAINLGGRLHILGYPLAGGSAINYTEVALGGFDENGALLKVNASLNEGYSGGPVLVEQDGHFAIAGVVILRRADVSFIRSIDQLNKLIWEPEARRVWADNVQISVQGSEANAMLQISAEIHALDYVNRKGRVLAYVFDANARQPWLAENDSLDHSTNGQMVLYQEFSATHMVDVLQSTILTLPLSRLNTQTDQVVFKLLLWDMDETRALWRDNQWHRPQQRASEVAIAPTQTSTITLSPTSMSTPTVIVTPTDTFEPTSTPTATATETPPPTNTPTPSVTNTPVPTPPTQIVEQEITGVVAVARLNLRVRQGPGTNFSIIGSMSSGETVTILSRNPTGDWWYVCCISGTTQEGWVAAQFIQPNFDLGQANTLIPVDRIPVDSVSKPEPGFAIINTNRLRVRNEPSDDAPIAGYAYNGETYEVIATSADGLWIQIPPATGDNADNPNGGWVMTEFLLIGQ